MVNAFFADQQSSEALRGKFPYQSGQPNATSRHRRAQALWIGLLDKIKLERRGHRKIRVHLKVYDSLEDCFSENKFNNIFAITKFGKENLFSIKFDIDDAFLFGNETSGLPSEILNS